MSKINLRIALAKALLKLASVETKEGILNYEGDLAVGTEVFVEDENGEVIPAADGEYTTDENIYVVAEGKIAEIRPVEKPAEETQVAAEEETPATPNYEEAIKALQDEIETLRGEIETLRADLDAVKDGLAKSTEEQLSRQTPTQKPAWNKIG